MHEDILDCIVCRDKRRAREANAWRTSAEFRDKLRIRRRRHQLLNVERWGTTHKP